MKVIQFAFVVCVAIVGLQQIGYTNAQGFSQLSYANADIGEKLIRQTSSTPPPVPTTKKSSFFGGVRSFFSKKSTTEAPSTTTTAVPVTSTTPPPTVSTPRSIASGLMTVGKVAVAVPAPIVPPAVPQNVVPSTTAVPKPAVIIPSTTTTTSTTTSTTTTTTTTTTKIPVHTEDFPPLAPPRRRKPSGGSTTTAVPVTAASLHPVWSTSSTVKAVSSTTSRPLTGVSFVARPPTGSPSKNGAAVVTPASVPALTPEDADLEALTEALFVKETNIFSKLTVAYQGRTNSFSLTDEAPNPLFTIDDATLESVPAISQMRLLYNNYELDTSINEYVSPMEKKEENEFVDTIMATPIMRQAMQFLQQKGKVTADPQTHRDLVKTIWFTLYSRSRGKISSSAFEHVFLSEMKNGSASGLHNWVYFRDEEKAGNADYKGYIKKVDLGTKGSIVKYRLTFNQIGKPVNTMFVGTSPELELALYTVCFTMLPDKKCPVSLGGQKFKIQTYTLRYRGKSLIGTAIPEI